MPNNRKNELEKTIIIRKFKSADRKAVEHIHFETGLFGKSMSRYLTEIKEFDKQIAYYLEREPESIFVAESENEVVGYLLGCLDDSKNDEIKSGLCRMFSVIFKIPFMPKKDRKYWWITTVRIIKIIFSGDELFKLKTPNNAGHIHINLLPKYRGKGIGTYLLKEYIKYAKFKGAKRIHAGSYLTRLNPNKNFWKKNGFREYIKVKSSLWEDFFPDEEMFVVFYLKEL
ncbi:MAG: GNAT family N-acetyltransferase [archaeon]